MYVCMQQLLFVCIECLNLYETRIKHIYISCCMQAASTLQRFTMETLQSSTALQNLVSRTFSSSDTLRTAFRPPKQMLKIPCSQILLLCLLLLAVVLLLLELLLPLTELSCRTSSRDFLKPLAIAGNHSVITNISCMYWAEMETLR